MPHVDKSPRKGSSGLPNAQSPFLETDRLIVRELSTDDWPAMETMMLDPRITRFMHLQTWETPEGRRAWFEWTVANQTERVGGNYNWAFVTKDTKDLVGWIGIGDSDRKELEGDRSVGFMVDPRFWRQGFMTEALTAVLDHEFNVLGVSRVIATCEVENVASARVMEKAGMQFLRTMYDADPLEGNYAERHHYALERGGTGNSPKL